MRRHSLLFASFILYAASSASADTAYDVSVDTSSIAGTVGSLDFQFNPGPLVSQSASLQILNFTSDGTLVPPAFPTGDVTGTLPSTLTFDNGSGFNDYFQGFTFGSSLAFNVSLFGPALSSPDGVSTSGSTFAFSMFADAAGTQPVLTSDTTDGFASVVTVNLDGSTTVTNFSPQATLASASVAPVPEPRGTVLLIAAMTALLVSLRSRHRA